MAFRRTWNPLKGKRDGKSSSSGGEWGKIYILVGGISLLFSLRHKDETRPRSFLGRGNFNESSYRDSGANETWWQKSHTEEERRFISPVCLALFKRKYVSLNGFYLQQLASVVLKSCSEFLFAFDECGCETSPPSPALFEEVLGKRFLET